MRLSCYRLLVPLIVILFLGSCGRTEQPQQPFTIQLNWLHDPTFAGEYLLAQRKGTQVQVREGGPNIFPVSEVLSGRAAAAVVGADIFLQAVHKSLEEGKSDGLVCFSVDFQRNPVGWVLHPDAASRAGLPDEYKQDQKALNRWLFKKLVEGKIQMGDKRGTETTSIWLQWKQVHKLPDSVNVVPVGFDASLVLTAPMLAYPVYLNEEPFKLSERIGKRVVVFDPAVDGVDVYGNVLVTSRAYIQNNPGRIQEVQRSLAESWIEARRDMSSATRTVMSVYKGVSEGVVQKQIEKTVEFVFYGTQSPGTMDISESGKWARTLKALQSSGSVGASLNLERLNPHLLPTQ